MYTVQIPNLPTLVKPPSWCKSSGNIDRSACVEVRLSEVRQLAGCTIYQEPHKYPYGLRRIGVRPLPGERPARNTIGRLATGLHFITADQVLHLFDTRPPRQLAGDFRTARAPAMRAEDWKPFQGAIDRGGFAPMRYGHPRRDGNKSGFRCRLTRQRQVLPWSDFGLDANPNKGAARSKMIGIPSDWFQPLRLEKWQFQTKMMPSYYLVCPGNPAVQGSICHGKVQAHEQAGVSDFDRWRYGEMNDAERWKLAVRDDRFPPLSTAKRGAHWKGCPQRVLKLYLAMCSKGEWRDARMAQAWIESLPPRVHAAQLPFIGGLLDRYGMFFSPRLLVCRRCLGLRYGNHPDTVRRSCWRWRKGTLPPGTA